MNKEKIIQVMDSMIEAEWTIEGLEEISLLMMDAFKKHDMSVSGKLFYCYYSLLGKAGKQIENSLELLNDVITELKSDE